MLRVVWRGFLARKLRAALTATAIALGVALMAGTYVLTDTINASFAGIFTTANAGNAVVVTPHQALGSGFNAQAQISPITTATLARVRALPGVAAASGTLFSAATFFTDAGKRMNSRGPSFVSAVIPKPFESFEVIAGRFPTSADELALDQATAGNEHLRVGQAMRVAGAGPAKRYTIVGIVKFAGSQSFGGAGAALFILPEAQRVVGAIDRFDAIDVAAAPGVTPAQLQARVRAALPATLDVRTGAQQAAKQSSDLASNLGFLRTFLLIFAYVSLFVGAFIIFNTFSITVAQRTRELGLLRALGARKGQVMRVVLAESLLLGVGGAAIGLAAGIGIAPALDQLFKSFGADLPDNGTVLAARTVIVSLAVGTGVTLIAGLAPALRATRVQPVDALREGVALPPGRLSRYALPASVAVLLAGIALLIGGLAGGGGALALGVGALVVFIGIALLSPRLVPPLARILGRLVTWRGVTGRLARENAMRQPGRTAVTAAALMIGVALVTFVSVLAAGTKASINRAVDASFAGDLIVENSQATNGQGIPTAIAPALRQVPGIARVTPIAFTLGRVQGLGGNSSVTAIDPSSFGQVYRIDWQHGSNATLAQLGTSGTILTKRFADANGFKLGQTLSVLTAADRRVALRVVGIATDNARLLGNLTVTLALSRQAFGQRDDALDFVAYARGATNAQVQPAVERLLSARFPQARSRTAAQFKRDQAGQINTLLALIYVLLALAVIVSLFGIVNTLVLSIYERVRELGLLRAIGTSRRQIRQMVRYEAIITALIGGVIGLVVGVLFAIVITRPLAADGFVLSIPIPTLIILLVAAALAGRWAAVLPARRAARLDILAALASE